MWDEYNRIDPDYRAGDLVLNIEVEGGGYEEYTVASGDNLTKIAKHWNKNWKEIWMRTVRKSRITTRSTLDKNCAFRGKTDTGLEFLRRNFALGFSDNYLGPRSIS